MKTIGRILIILLAFTIVMGLVYMAVGSGSSTTVSGNQRFERGERPEFPGAERGERFEGGGVGWIFGAIKNIAVISIIVGAIVVPKGWLQRRQRQLQSKGA